MNTLICILYTAINIVNPYYTISDIIRFVVYGVVLSLSLLSPPPQPIGGTVVVLCCRWIRQSKIPYFNADKCLPDDMKLVNKDHNIFTHLVGAALYVK